MKKIINVLVVLSIIIICSGCNTENESKEDNSALVYKEDNSAPVYKEDNSAPVYIKKVEIVDQSEKRKSLPELSYDPEYNYDDNIARMSDERTFFRDYIRPTIVNNSGKTIETVFIAYCFWDETMPTVVKTSGYDLYEIYGELSDDERSQISSEVFDYYESNFPTNYYKFINEIDNDIIAKEKSKEKENAINFFKQNGIDNIENISDYLVIGAMRNVNIPDKAKYTYETYDESGKIKFDEFDGTIPLLLLLNQKKPTECKAIVAKYIDTEGNVYDNPDFFKFIKENFGEQTNIPTQ